MDNKMIKEELEKIVNEVQKMAETCTKHNLSDVCTKHLVQNFINGTKFAYTCKILEKIEPLASSRQQKYFTRGLRRSNSAVLKLIIELQKCEK